MCTLWQSRYSHLHGQHAVLLSAHDSLRLLRFLISLNVVDSHHSSLFGITGLRLILVVDTARGTAPSPAAGWRTAVSDELILVAVADHLCLVNAYSNTTVKNFSGQLDWRDVRCA